MALGADLGIEYRKMLIVQSSPSTVLTRLLSSLEASWLCGNRINTTLGSLLMPVSRFSHCFARKTDIFPQVFMSVLIGSFSMAMVQPEMQKITKAQGAAAKLFATIDRVPPIDSADPGGEKPDEVHGTISFEGVKFHYPSRPNVPVLKGLTIDFPAGKTTALVGSSGSGKSTVVNLVERFYDPIAGSIKLDGRELSSLNIKWLRQNIGKQD